MPTLCFSTLLECQLNQPGGGNLNSSFGIVLLINYPSHHLQRLFEKNIKVCFFRTTNNFFLNPGDSFTYDFKMVIVMATLYTQEHSLNNFAKNSHNLQTILKLR